MDMLDALRLQWEWGADEALLDSAQNRALTPAPVAALAPRPSAAPEARPRTRLATLPVGPEQAAEIAAGCASLAALHAALNNFTGCALRDTATQLVFGDGPEDARLVIIGDAPGAEEDRAGKPFMGPDGQLLERMLASIGLSRAQVRLINTLPWRPPGNRPAHEAEIAQCLPFLHRHIALIRPKFLLALGAVAAKALLPAEGAAGIRRLRGVWRDANITGLESPLPCLPSYHPAYLLRTPMAKSESWRDILALRAALESGIITKS